MSRPVEWSKIKHRGLLKIHEVWNYPDKSPMCIPRKLFDEIDKDEIEDLTRVAHEVRFQWRSLEWPTLGKELSDEIESNNDEESIVNWVTEIREVVYNNFEWLRCNYNPNMRNYWVPHKYFSGNQQVMEVLPAKPDLNGVYSKELLAQLGYFGFDMACTYYRL